MPLEEFLDVSHKPEDLSGKGRGIARIFKSVYHDRPCVVKMPNTYYFESDGFNFQNESESVDLLGKELEKYLKISERAFASVMEIIRSEKKSDYGPWFAMEWGMSDFNEVIKGNKPYEDEKEKIKQVVNLLKSLERLHINGIYHLDIKPENIIRSENTWKFIDFETAEVDGNNTYKFQWRPNSAEYLCPDILDNENKFDRRAADLWAVGIILYKVLTGYSPYREINEDNYRDVLREGPDLDKIDKSLYAGVLKTALNKDPNERFLDCSEFIAALENNTEITPGYLNELKKGEVGWSSAYSEARKASSLAVSRDGKRDIFSDLFCELYRGIYQSQEIHIKDSDMAYLEYVDEKKNPSSLWLAGEIYAAGLIGEKNPDRALRLFSRSAKSSPLGAWAYGRLVSTEEKLKRNPQKLENAVKFLKNAKNYGFTDAESIITQLNTRSGKCGPACEWLFTESKFVVKGEGDMMDFKMDVDLCDRVEEVVIKQGIGNICDEAFSNCVNLSSVTLPSSLEYIGINAFRGCRSLTMIYLMEGLESIQDGAFEDCEKLNTVSLPAGLESIGERAFCGCGSLTEIELPDGLTAIGAEAFRNTGIRSVKVPDSVTDFDRSAFNTNCDVDYNEPAPKAEEDLSRRLNDTIKWAFSKGRLTISGNGEMNDGRDEYSQEWPWDEYKQDIVTVEINDGIEDIGNYAFAGCTELSEIQLPDSVESIGYRAFLGCTSLRRVSLSDSIGFIGEEAFYNCPALQSITLPEALAEDRESFLDDTCDIVTSGTSKESGKTARGECGDDASWSLSPDGVLTIDGSGDIEEFITDYIRENAKSLVIGEGIESVCDNVFAGCANLTSISLPDSLTFIGTRSFLGCSSLKEVRIPKNVEEIGINAFISCKALKEVYVSGNNALNLYGVFEDNCNIIRE